MKTKAELRTMYRELRKQMTTSDVENYSSKILEHFILQFNPTENQKIHCFLPIEKFREVDTIPLMNYCFEHGIRFFVPKVMGDKLISVELFPDSELEYNAWGILEPKTHVDAQVKDFDFVITPLLYCDPNGNRVGYGKGFYDGLFSSISTNGLKIGVNFFPPKECISDLRSEDISLDYLIIPSSVFSFKIG